MPVGFADTTKTFWTRQKKQKATQSRLTFSYMEAGPDCLTDCTRTQGITQQMH